MTYIPPKVFISYSHDSELHKGWVLALATRLMANGVEVILDQWDLTLGSNLPKFMEKGLLSAQRVIAICTEPYVQKANEGIGGTGYEKLILTAQLMENIDSDRIIPIIRSNEQKSLVPTFLSSSLYIDFRDDMSYESKYGELIRDLHGQEIKPRPPLGVNPFTVKPPLEAPIVSFGPERYVSSTMTGTVTFDYSNNNGRFVFGAGDMAFETAWSKAGNDSIHAYNDPPSIRSVALAVASKEIAEIGDARQYDPSSRTRTPCVGEILIWQNTVGYFLATKILSIQTRNQENLSDEIKIEYKIASTKSSNFTI